MREVTKCDLLAAPLRHLDRRRQELGHRVVEPDLAAHDHVGQDEGGEDLGDGADLVDGVGAGEDGAAGGRGPRGEKALARRVHQPDDDADGPVVLARPVEQELLELAGVLSLCDSSGEEDQPGRELPDVLHVPAFLGDRGGPVLFSPANPS
ncbi:MAG: hypothetical protein MZV63_65260 [Marinilabiliales bacterium]|nr:hypothetical protein [Marinilabiliales bacterium]